MRTSSRSVVKRAKELRREMTPPEYLLWRWLRTRPGGNKFRYQHAYGPFVLDFFSHKAALCIEVDGTSHNLGCNPQRDARRDSWLANQGICTVRVLASDILDDLEPITLLIQEVCASRSPSTGFAGPPPLQRQGRMK
jgi:very-short-patch-repair endonuclease